MTVRHALRAAAATLLGSTVLAGPAAAQIVELKRMSLEELSQQEVFSVSKRPEPYGRAPAAIHVITQEDIRRSGATTLPEALRLATNLMVAQKNAHAWAISARGFNADLANKLLVLIDGRTVYTPLFSGVFWDRQDYLLEDIDRIEVVSGPGGTLWGANAVNGVINVITRHAQQSQGFYAEGGGGQPMLGHGAVRYGGTLAPSAFYRVYGKYGGHDDELLPDGRDAADSWRTGQAGFRIDAERSKRDTLTLQGDFYAGREHVGSGARADLSGGNVLGRWSRTLGKESDLSLQVYYDRTHLRLPVPALRNADGIVLAPGGALEDDLDTFDVDFNHRLPARGRHHLTWGLAYRFTHDSVVNAPALAFEPPELSQQLVSAFAQDEIALSSDVMVTIGSKVEHNDYTGFEAEPSARLQWTLSPKHLVWAAVSRAIRMPSRVDRDERVPTPRLAPFLNNLLIGGADFRSETVVAYEVGARAQVNPSLLLSSSIFFNDYDHLRSTSLSPPDPILRLPFPLFFDNNLEGETYGVELSASAQALPAWRVQGGYTWFGEDIRVKPGRFDFSNALNETADPHNQIFLRSSVDLPRRVEVDVAFRWIDRLRFNDGGIPGEVPSYAELDARLGWSPTRRLELSLTARNLLHDRHPEYAISSPNPREEIGRGVQAKAAVRW